MEKKVKQFTVGIVAACLFGSLTFAVGYRIGASKTGASSMEPAPAPPNAALVQAPTGVSKAEVEMPTTEPSLESIQAPTPMSPREEGYQAASSNIENALEQIEILQGRERLRFARGVFEYLASVQEPDLSLELANLQDPMTRDIALKTLVSEWNKQSGTNSPQDAEALSNRIFDMRGSSVGIEAALSSFLASSSVSPSVREAWIQTFAQHPGRSEIQARIAANGTPEQIQAALANSQTWTEWERRNFSESLLYQWTQQSPAEAWDWYQKSGDKLEESQTDLIIETWASRNPDNLLQQLDKLDLGTQRETAILSLSRSLARRGTLDAMNWADSLSDSTERDLAYQAIYDATPKGIGAQVGIESGFLRIDQIMPEGALRDTEVQAGDLIVEAREFDGRPVSLYGKSLRESIGALRGAPGSQVEIRYLRRDPATGEFEERTTTVTRDLLVNEG
ncbi:hypothetical protein [Pelagicoccus sp. SDUM812002]|uniref:hypothetical protein n=1 Tax=Pelagicoccus sp. SDUM812002 TaxID=3041266 RepID=UPI00280D0EAF|nr:hypothetical protein [Pelagicoccus sp. SDUM812002]MDQ8185814.1 hypothetical protein [Pelagicoccus sp. SDUM812002]